MYLQKSEVTELLNYHITTSSLAVNNPVEAFKKFFVSSAEQNKFLVSPTQKELYDEAIQELKKCLHDFSDHLTLANILTLLDVWLIYQNALSTDPDENKDFDDKFYNLFKNIVLKNNILTKKEIPDQFYLDTIKRFKKLEIEYTGIEAELLSIMYEIEGKLNLDDNFLLILSMYKFRDQHKKFNSSEDFSKDIITFLNATNSKDKIVFLNILFYYNLLDKKTFFFIKTHDDFPYSLLNQLIKYVQIPKKYIDSISNAYEKLKLLNLNDFKDFYDDSYYSPSFKMAVIYKIFIHGNPSSEAERLKKLFHLGKSNDIDFISYKHWVIILKEGVNSYKLVNTVKILNEKKFLYNEGNNQDDLIIELLAKNCPLDKLNVTNALQLLKTHNLFNKKYIIEDTLNSKNPHIFAYLLIFFKTKNILNNENYDALKKNAENLWEIYSAIKAIETQNIPLEPLLVTYMLYHPNPVKLSETLYKNKNIYDFDEIYIQEYTENISNSEKFDFYFYLISTANKKPKILDTIKSLEHDILHNCIAECDFTLIEGALNLVNAQIQTFANSKLKASNVSRCQHHLNNIKEKLQSSLLKKLETSVSAEMIAEDLNITSINKQIDYLYFSALKYFKKFYSSSQTNSSELSDSMVHMLINLLNAMKDKNSEKYYMLMGHFILFFAIQLSEAKPFPEMDLNNTLFKNIVAERQNKDDIRHFLNHFMHYLANKTEGLETISFEQFIKSIKEEQPATESAITIVNEALKAQNDLLPNRKDLKDFLQIFKQALSPSSNQNAICLFHNYLSQSETQKWEQCATGMPANEGPGGVNF